MSLNDVMSLKIPQFIALLNGYTLLKEEEKRIIEKEERKARFFNRVKI